MTKTAPLIIPCYLVSVLTWRSARCLSMLAFLQWKGKVQHNSLNCTPQSAANLLSLLGLCIKPSCEILLEHQDEVARCLLFYSLRHVCNDLHWFGMTLNSCTCLGGIFKLLLCGLSDECSMVYIYWSEFRSAGARPVKPSWPQVAMINAYSFGISVALEMSRWAPAPSIV